MGGTKKKPINKVEKGQEAVQQPKPNEPPSKREKETKRMGWGIPKLTDDQAAQSLGPLKAITIYGASKALGVKASVASAVIKSLENRGLLKREGGYSGHYVYSLSTKLPDTANK